MSAGAPAPGIDPRLAAAWRRALAAWPGSIRLSPPRPAPPGSPHPAWIDLKTRDVFVDLETLEALGVPDTAATLLAHEIGHHLHHPRDRVTAARQLLLMFQVAPDLSPAILNLFNDLRIDHALPHDLAVDMQRFFAATTRTGVIQRLDPTIAFFYAVYEAIWETRPGALLGVLAAPLHEWSPGYRRHARAVARALVEPATSDAERLLYFLHVIRRYIDPDAPRAPGMRGCSVVLAGAGDFAAALEETPAELAALQLARDMGWFARDGDRSPPHRRRLDVLPDALPAGGPSVAEVLGAQYEARAEASLLRLPTRPAPGDAILPTTLEDWEAGDPLRDLDWRGTLLARGRRWGGVSPLRRERIAEEEGADDLAELPRVEVWLDTSGSMPDPRHGLNAMTLAAAILVVAALRASGSARVVLYSDTAIESGPFTRDLGALTAFLVGYIGRGTCFPFGLLRESTRTHAARPPTRVVISDQDFLSNFHSHVDNPGFLAEAARGSRALVSLLHLAGGYPVEGLRAAGARVAIVRHLDDLPATAAQLASCLTEGKEFP